MSLFKKKESNNNGKSELALLIKIIKYHRKQAI